ncbi:ribonuclease P protein component [Mycoplasmopsis alligatoris]|uniref:Ribonuclease P protein component n=1 Tax=Mycoplasmopsis alligatoris A21JP2 TaxID=747682 RepID=D4XWK6_9BACT|nr:ribonuclease P protein component [Mycoplasmopsis alligatoris]EFF41326.1 ribonuclease P protein component [Mycoplasmopsis alligatoris A21JP2]
MKKQYRLQKNWEFNDLIRRNKQFSNNFLVAYYQKADSLKVGITVPKKFANAVWRNYYKRQLRAIIHQANIYELNYHFVFIVRKEFLNADFALKKESIQKMLEKFKNESKKIK